jgi:hypothetical protein
VGFKGTITKQLLPTRLPAVRRPGSVPGMADPHDDGPEPDSRKPAVIGLVVVLALVVVAYFLVNALRKNANLEDCLMSGRSNCAPIEAPASGR